MMQKGFLLLLIGTLFSACAPQVTDRIFNKPQTEFGAEARDTDLRLRVREYGENPPALGLQGALRTGEFFSLLESVSLIGRDTGRADLTQKAWAWLEAYERSSEIPRISVADSPFTGLATAQTQPEVQSALDDVLASIEEARPLIRNYILAMPTEPVTADLPLREILKRARNFSARVAEGVPQMGLDPVVAEPLQVEITKTTEQLFAKAEVALQQLEQAKTLSQAVTIVDQAVTDFEIELPPELKKSISQGKSLGKNIDRMQDSQGALTVLVDVWRMLTPEERGSFIKPVNEELYNFLVKQDDKELQCLRTPGCLGGPIDGVVKKLFIQPKLEKYGVSRLKKEMNEKTLEYVITSIQQFAQEFVAKLGQTFSDSIDKAIGEKAGRILVTRNNYPAYVKRVTDVWAKQILPQSQGTLAGFESAKLDVVLVKNTELVLKAQPAGDFIAGDVVGPSLAINTMYLQQKDFEKSVGRERTLSALNKLIGFTGYRDSEGKIVPPLLAPFSEEGPLLDIMNFASSKDAKASFRIPEQAPRKNAFELNSVPRYERNFSVASMASQIRGLSHFMRLTADWQTSVFDRYLGDIQAQDVTQDAESDKLKQPLFPKDQLFALNLGAAAVLLQDLTKAATPIYLYTLEGPIIWADNFKNSGDTAVKAGAVDIIAGEKASLSSASDIAQLIIAGAEFLEVTQEANRTKSPILKKPSAPGEEPPIKALLEGREDLKLLLVALSNMLSTQLTSKDGLIISKVDYVQRLPAVSRYQLMDQALGIRALLAAYRATGIDAYKWSAQEIYFAMNKKLYNKAMEFYLSQEQTEVTFQEVVACLQAFAELQDHLPQESRMQLRRVMQPWLESLQALP